MWTIFKVFIEFGTILLLFYVLAFDRRECRILVPRPGVEPTPPALKDEVLTTRQPGKSHSHILEQEEACNSKILGVLNLS